MSEENMPLSGIRIDNRPLSQGQLLGFLVVLATQAFIAGGLYYKFTTLATDAASKADFAALTAKVDNQEAGRLSRSASLDRDVENIQVQLKPLATIEFRMAASDKRDDAQDARIDKILELVSGELRALNENVAQVKADVRVMGVDLKNLTGKTQPTMFRNP